LLVAGFGRAARLRATQLAPGLPAVAAVAAAEPSLIAECNSNHRDAMALLGDGEGAWRMVALDVDGFDLAPADAETGLVRRIAWSAPISSGEASRAELARIM